MYKRDKSDDRSERKVINAKKMICKRPAWMPMGEKDGTTNPRKEKRNETRLYEVEKRAHHMQQY